MSKNNITFAIIKPDAIKNKFEGKIYNHIIETQFEVIGLKKIHMSIQQAQNFYEIHKDKPFYDELTQFMSSGACMILALEKDDAVVSWRETIGATDPKEAAEGTIRKDFAANVQENAVHGSDSDENAEKEIGFFFTQSELTANQ